jgi:hypothetical protein
VDCQPVEGIQRGGRLTAIGNFEGHHLEFSIADTVWMDSARKSLRELVSGNGVKSLHGLNSCSTRSELPLAF